jgi:hypothetical protein
VGRPDARALGVRCAAYPRRRRRYKNSSIDTARSHLKAFRAEFGSRVPRTIARTEAEGWAATVPPSALPIVVQLMHHLHRGEEIDRNRFEGLSHRPTLREWLAGHGVQQVVMEALAPRTRAIILSACPSK